MSQLFNVQVVLTRTYQGKDEPLIAHYLIEAETESAALRQARKLKYPHVLPESEFRIVPRLG